MPVSNHRPIRSTSSIDSGIAACSCGTPHTVCKYPPILSHTPHHAPQQSRTIAIDLSPHFNDISRAAAQRRTAAEHLIHVDPTTACMNTSHTTDTYRGHAVQRRTRNANLQFTVAPHTYSLRLAFTSLSKVVWQLYEAPSTLFEAAYKGLPL